MDTESAVKKRTSAVLVDYELWANNPRVRAWCDNRAPFTNLVLLVSHPDVFDYNASYYEGTNFTEFDVVIRNSGNKNVTAFKLNAMRTLNAVSNLTVVFAIEPNTQVRWGYDDMGILYTLTEKDFV